MVGIEDSALISLESCIQSVLYREVSLYSFSKFYSNTLFVDPAIGRMGASNRKHKRLEPKHGKLLSMHIEQQTCQWHRCWLLLCALVYDVVEAHDVVEQSRCMEVHCSELF